MRVKVQLFRRDQKGVGCGLAVGDLRTGDNIVEIPRRAGGLQIHLDHIPRARACHNARQAHVLQRGQQLLQTLFAGYAPGKALVPQLPDLVQHLLRVAGDVLGHMAAQVVPRQAASPGLKLLHIRGQRQAQRGARGFPQGIPQALGVKHQPVHIKNNAFYHRCHPFAVQYTVIVPQSAQISKRTSRPRPPCLTFPNTPAPCPAPRGPRGGRGCTGPAACSRRPQTGLS